MKESWLSTVCFTERHGQAFRARVRLRASAADLSHALITGTSELRAETRAQILDALQRYGAFHVADAAYVTALEWTESVSRGQRPPDPIVFRSLGREADWLAALEFLASACAASDRSSAPLG